jgi:all-trans-retinol 13,14-reductase
VSDSAVGASYHQQHDIAEQWDAIVIGSGIGGLTVAALLAKYAGKRVLVLERHYVVGGYTHVFHRPGYEWDVGLHYVGQVLDPRFGLRALYDHVTEGRLRWHPMPDVYDRAVIGDREYEFVRGVENFRQRMRSYFPGEAGAIDRYLQALESCVRSSRLYFAEKAVPRPVARLAGGFMRKPFERWASRTTNEVLSGMTGNRELISVLTAQWADYGLPPGKSSFAAHAIIAQHYLEGAGYPVGGGARIAAAIAPAIEAAGGRIIHSAEVGHVLLDGAQRAVGVCMKDTRQFRAPIVVSDTGAWNTFSRLLPAQAPGCAAAMHELRSMPASVAHLCLYGGIRRSARELGFTGTNLWLFPEADHDANVARFLRDPSAPFPVLFVSFPSAKDPDFERRHPGRATLEAICPVPYEWFRGWEETRWQRRGHEYDDFKRALAERMRLQLEERLPSVRGQFEVAELSTPLSTRHFLNYSRGEIYGVGALPRRFQLRCLTPRTGVKNFYLTGQDVALLGVSGALVGGVLTASAILGRNLMGRLTKPFAESTAASAG